MDFENAGLLRALIDAFPMGVYLVDPARKILYWNAGAQRITGYTSQEVIGRCCRDNLLSCCGETGASLCQCTCPLSATMHDGEPREARMYLHHKSGHRIPVHVRTFAIRREDGHIIGTGEIFEPQHAVQRQPTGGFMRISQPQPNVAAGTQDSDMLAAIGQLINRQVRFGILSIQIEHIEQFQANHGQEATRALMRVVEDTVRNTLRGSDLLAERGKKLLVVLPDCDQNGLEMTSERIRRIVTGAGIEWWGDWLPASVAIGAASFSPGDTTETLVARAEELLNRNLDSLERARAASSGG